MTWADPTTLDVVLRPGHEVPRRQAGDRGRRDLLVPRRRWATSRRCTSRSRPNIATIEKTGDRQHALQAEGAERLVPDLDRSPRSTSFPSTSGSRSWRARGQAGERRIATRSRSPIGSGPFKVARFKLNEEIVLEKHAAHWSAPKMDRWILRIVPNNEASARHAASRRDQLPVGLPRRPQAADRSRHAAEGHPGRLDDRHGLRFVGYNLRRPPFDDPAFRQALSIAVEPRT